MAAATSGGPGRRLMALMAAVVRRFVADHCLMRASALAYTSLLSIVPLLALMFAVLKGLGVQHRLEPLLLSRLSLDQATTDMVIDYIDRTNVSTLGTLGAATLVLTVISVLGAIETSFNAIWRVSQERSWWRKVTDYLSVVLLAPFLLLAAAALTSSLQFQQVLQWIQASGPPGEALLRALRLAPIAINSVGIGILYAVMPNRRPSWPAIGLGAVIAGALWHGMQWGYVSLQVGVARSNAIYGALAQLPVTLVWLYLSWAVVLAGAELAAVFEFDVAERDAPRRPVRRAAVALDLLLRAARAFAHGREGVDPTAVARHLRIDVGVVTHCVQWLVERGWLLATAGARPRYVLACDPARIALGELDGLDDGASVPRRCDARVHAAFDAASAAERRPWMAWCLVDVMRGVAPAGNENQTPG